MKNCLPVSITFWASLATRAKDLITHQPVSISEDLTVREAASFLIDQNLSLAPVINEAGRPVGVLSRTDIMRYQMNPVPVGQDGEEEPFSRDWSPAGRSDEGTLIGTARVRDIMTPMPTSVIRDASIEGALGQMRMGHMRRLPVVDGMDKLVGIIALDDILRHLAEEVSEVEHLLESESPRRTS